MKKLISLALILAMLCTALTGCGADDPPAADHPDNTDQAAPNRPADTPSSTEKEALPMKEENNSTTVSALSQALYPQTAPYPDKSDYYESDGSFQFELYQDDLRLWEEEAGKRRALAENYDSPTAFYASAIPQFLCGTGNENRVCSPVNVYLALAMLAEITGGENREEILDLLGAEDLDALRNAASNIWLSNYSDDGSVTNILASSLWLNEDIAFRQAAVDALSEYYYASVYQGRMGSAELNRALQNWLNEQTKGLLENQASEMEFDRGSILALASTVYFKAGWSGQFNEKNTTDDIFHGKDGDITHPFLHRSDTCHYYRGGHFAAVPLSFTNSGKMWLILPDEDTTVDELLRESPEVFDLVRSSNEWENTKLVTVNLSVPKFDVVSMTDLSASLQTLGLKDIFDAQRADFSPIMEETRAAWVSEVNHAARVKIDEEGCEAAAFTMIMVRCAALLSEEKVDFTLDRPFLFVITGVTGEPLFAGVVNQP